MERNKEYVDYKDIIEVLDKYDYYYDKDPAASWVLWKHKNPFDNNYNIELSPRHNHLVIMHCDEEGNNINDIEPVQAFYESVEQFEAIIRAITDIEMLPVPTQIVDIEKHHKGE